MAHAVRTGFVGLERLEASSQADPRAMELRRAIALVAYQRGHSWHAIAEALGGRHHTTIITAARRGRAELKADPRGEFAQLVARLTAAVDGHAPPTGPAPGALRQQAERAPPEEGSDEMMRLRGTMALADALRRAHPERMVTLEAAG